MELVLSTFGTSLSRDNEAFVVAHKDGKQRVPTDGLRSIVIGRGVQVSSDAMMLAIDNEIELLIVERSGKPVGRVWSNKYGSISTIRKGQLEFAGSKTAVEWIKDVIIHKMGNQQALLYAFAASREDVMPDAEAASRKIERYREKTKALQGETVGDIAAKLRGYEGVASRAYFNCMNLFLPADYRFATRSQHPATDVVNAFLNYAYGILYGKVEGALVKAGIDPYIGILHRDDYNRPVMVYDVIERYRVWADYVVWVLACRGGISEECYSVQTDGSYWLEGLGRRILIQSLNDYMNEVIDINGMERSRLTHIDLYCQNLAQTFK